MRVSSGTAKSRNLKTPKIPGIRLTQEIVRQAVFSILGEDLRDSRCLDLFAGSGSVGLEALSRGASWCDFVDINPLSISTIKENLKICAFEDRAHVELSDSLKYVVNCHKTYEFVFMDPYYDQAAHKHIFKNISVILNPKGRLVFFHGGTLKTEEFLHDTHLKLLDERKYGATVVSILVDNKA